MTIMKITNSLLLLSLMALATACGEYWEGGDPVQVRQMRLPKKVINLMVGDRYQIPVEFTPDVAANRDVWWQTADYQVAEMDDGYVVGVSEGLTKAYAMSVTDRLQDSCLVNVIPGAYLNPNEYPYDMVIYADVTIHGEKYTKEDEDDLIIAAYCEDELRGIGKMRSAHGRPYMEIRIWSPFVYGDWIDLMCIYRGKALIELFPDQMLFDGEAHGSLSNLLPLVIDENAEEYYFGYIIDPDDNPFNNEEEEIVGGDTDE